MTETGQPKADHLTEPSGAPAAATPNVEAAPTIIVQSGLPYVGGPIFGAPADMLRIPAVLAQQTVQSWQGPYPSPEAIEKYERVLPGAFDRILSMAERHQAAQIEDTSRAQEYLRNDMRRVHWLGAGVAFLSIVGAVACTIYGSPVVAVALVGVPVLSVAKALIDSVRARPANSVAGTGAVPQSPAPPAASAANTAKKASGASAFSVSE